MTPRPEPATPDARFAENVKRRAPSHVLAALRPPPPLKPSAGARYVCPRHGEVARAADVETALGAKAILAPRVLCTQCGQEAERR